MSSIADAGNWAKPVLENLSNSPLGYLLDPPRKNTLAIDSGAN
jgi:hypothetical protein